ncbi:hypothetical protein HLB44_36060 [Aquincola sp. S2]|uniref:Uncharacterized protein n=1 Tax=Pseudaquabacterium terrae TaxID=2732868 RepID=A0ABX2EUI7_9BURK|nr:hypothetical protein [Aquabacterium terrae]NRF72405.1 hypothetical protein [Aquabacterium terrae]
MSTNAPRIPVAARIAAAVLSVSITGAVFSGVISASEPQRSQLAALHRHQPVGEPRVVVAEATAQQASAASKRNVAVAAR